MVLEKLHLLGSRVQGHDKELCPPSGTEVIVLRSSGAFAAEMLVIGPQNPGSYVICSPSNSFSCDVEYVFQLAGIKIYGM